MSEKVDDPCQYEQLNIPQKSTKSRITIRLDQDLIDHFKKQVQKAGGGKYQTLINVALREHVDRQKNSLEQVVRQALRKELQEFHKAA